MGEVNPIKDIQPTGERVLSKRLPVLNVVLLHDP